MIGANWSRISDPYQICDVCQRRWPGMGVLKFDVVPGAPCICDLCIYKALTNKQGQDIPFSEAYQRRLDAHDLNERKRQDKVRRRQAKLDGKSWWRFW